MSASTTRTVRVGDPLVLTGAATDPEGGALTFLWESLASPPGAIVVLGTPTAPTTDVTGTLPAGDYAFRFTADDGALETQVNLLATVEESIPEPTAAVFVHDRQAVALGGTVPVHRAFAGGPVSPTAVDTPAFEGGFSGLARVRDGLGGYVPGEYWIVNDRGCNYSITSRVPPAPPGATAFGAGAKLFPLPTYGQKILKVRTNVATGDLELLSATPVRDRGGVPTVGLPSSVAGMTTAEAAYTDAEDKGSVLPASPQGFDLEGIFEDRFTFGGADRRVFWTCDEYGPALQMLEADPASAAFGQMLREYIPGATPDPGAGLLSLPAVLRNRRDNRGFEGLAVTRRHVYAMVQSTFKTSFTTNANTRLHRLVRVDKQTGEVVMFGYDHVADPAAYGTTHGAVKVGDMVAVGECEFLVLEHDGANYVHVYRVRVTPATTALQEAAGNGYEAGTTPYTPVEKTLVADLTDLIVDLEAPTKPEGLVLVDPSTLALAFDNDYGFDSDDTHVFPLDGQHSRNMMAIVRLPAPVLPSIEFVAEFNSGLGAGNAEIVDVETSTGLGFVTADADGSVQVFDVQDPAQPFFLRRDDLGVGSATSVAVHPAFGYYLCAIRAGGPGGVDVVQVRATDDGALLRTIGLGLGRGPDAVTISPNGAFALVCNEAEDPWLPGSLATLALGTGPFATPAAAAAAIGAVNEIPLTGLVPSTGAFSTRWIDRPYNAPFAAPLTVTAGGVPVVVVDGNTQATAGGAPVADNAVVTFTFGATVVTARYKWDGAVSGGNDGNVFLFPLDGSALSLEPEIGAFNATSTLCAVTLQENNAVVVVDFALSPPALRVANPVLGLGKVDVSDADVVRNDPTSASPAKFDDLLNVEREPDGIAVFSLDGVEYFVTVDEGDSYGPDFTTSSNSRFRGGRTLSVFRLSDGQLMGDTGNRLDFLANAQGRWGAFLESSRARRGGSEPENLALKSIGGRVLAAVGLERANAIALVDLSDPACPSVLDLVGIGGLSPATARTAPEGIKFVPHGSAWYVLTAYELSGTVGVFRLR